MTGEEHVVALDPFAIFDREAARLDRHFSSLDDARWSEPSRCDGWTTRDMLAHLASAEEYHHACLDDQLEAFLNRLLDAGATDLAGFNEVGIRQFDELDPIQILERWRADNSQTRARMRERAEGTMTTMVPSYPVRLQALHVSSELATHADDIGVPESATEATERTAWRVPFSRFALAEEGRDVELEVVAGGHRVGRGGLAAELSDRDFVEAVAGRLGPDHPLPDELRRALSTAV